MRKTDYQAEQLRQAIDAAATLAQARDVARKRRAAAGRTAKVTRRAFTHWRRVERALARREELPA